MAREKINPEDIDPAPVRVREKISAADIDPPQAEDPGIGNTLASNFIQGATGGWADELGGLVGRATSNERVGTQTRDLMREEHQQATDAHPWLSAGAQIAGDLGKDFLLKQLGVPVGSLPYQLASGAVAGAGYSKEEDTPGVMLDAGIGTGISAAASGMGKYVVGPIASKLGRAVKPALKNFAAERAIKATGAIQSDIKGRSLETLRRMGRQLLEAPASADGTPVITAGVGKQTVLERAEKGMEMAGAAIGGILDQADEMAASSGQGGFDWTPVVRRLQSEIYDKLDPIARRTIGPVQNQVEAILEAAQSGAGFGVANRMKSSIQKSINWGADPKIVTNAAKAVQGILDDEIESQVAGRLGAQMGDEFKDAKSLYGAFALAENSADRGVKRELGNRFTGLSDYIAGGSAGAGLVAATGLPGLVAAPVALFGHKLMRESGASIAAVATKKLSDSDLLKNIISNSPAALGEWAPALARAAKESPMGLAVTDWVLSSQNPEYRERKKKALEQGRQEQGE